MVCNFLLLDLSIPKYHYKLNPGHICVRGIKEALPTSVGWGWGKSIRPESWCQHSLKESNSSQEQQRSTQTSSNASLSVHSGSFRVCMHIISSKSRPPNSWRLEKEGVSTLTFLQGLTFHPRICLLWSWLIANGNLNPLSTRLRTQYDGHTRTHWYNIYIFCSWSSCLFAPDFTRIR